jgi:hypothetical protein
MGDLAVWAVIAVEIVAKKNSLLLKSFTRCALEVELDLAHVHATKNKK